MYVTVPAAPPSTAPVVIASALSPNGLLLAAAESSAAHAGDAQAEPAPPPKSAPGALPNQVTIHYRLSWNGLPANGEMKWQRDGAAYQVELNLASFIGPQIRYRSEGRITRNGLQPTRYQALRNGDVHEKASFDWSSKTLHYGDGEDQQARLEPGAQDFLSIDWQLAYGGGKRLATPIQVTNGKKVYHYALAKAGAGHLGNLALDVYRTQKDDNTTEFSLARAYYHLPVRVLYKDEQKTIEMTATSIEVNGKTVWSAR
jgi:hypothetical protein